MGFLQLTSLSTKNRERIANQLQPPLTTAREWAFNLLSAVWHSRGTMPSFSKHSSQQRVKSYHPLASKALLPLLQQMVYSILSGCHFQRTKGKDLRCVMRFIWLLKELLLIWNTVLQPNNISVGDFKWLN